VYVVRFEESLKAGNEQENSASTEAGFEVDSSSVIKQIHCSTDEYQFDTVSASYKSLYGHQIKTDGKPPLMKKGKPHHKNKKSVFGENVGNVAGSSFVFSGNVPEAPGSAEMVLRKLRLPWRRKKNYMPGEEMSRWRSNFESWRSASQLSLESDGVTDRGLQRTASQTELQNVDTVSVSYSTDSDTDIMSDDPGSLKETGIFSFMSHLIL